MKSQYIISEGAQNPDIVGGKGYSLLKLKKEGIRVPEFFILNANAFDSYIKANQRAKTNIESPKEIINEVMESYSKYIKKGKVAVRSSATVEDSSKYSYAGKFKTDLFVTKGNLPKSVKDVYASLYRIKDFGYSSEHPKMAVVIQKQIDSEKSGVLFVTKDAVIINAIIGQGERFVSGKEVGDLYKIDLTKKKSTPSITVNFQEYANIKGHDRKLPMEVSYSRKLLSSEIHKLVKEAIKIYKIFNSPQDVEWCIKGNDIFILQSRPITSDLPKLKFEDNMSDIPVSAGIGKGIPWEDIRNIPESPVIIIKEEVELGDIKYLDNKNVAGIISRYDGMLSHVSILARELKIPYITGVNDFGKLLNSKEVYMDGSTGVIKVKGNDGRLAQIMNTAPRTFKWIHKGIKNIEYLNEAECLIRRSGKFAVLYSEDGRSIEEAFNKGLPNIIKLSGPSDVYTSYGLLFRSINAKVDGIKRFKEAFVKALDEKDLAKFRLAYNEAKSNMAKHYESAKASYSNYKRSKDLSELINTYIDSVKAYIFFNAIRNSAFDYAEYIFSREMSGRSGLISDAELYNGFSDTGKGKLIGLRKELISMLDDISNAADENADYSMMDLEEQAALELKKKIGNKKYEEITKSNFG